MVGESGESPSWLAPPPSGNGGGGERLDTSDWFSSNLPPAREQPEAANLRASDEDDATREAHAGLTADPTEAFTQPPLADGQADLPPLPDEPPST